MLLAVRRLVAFVALPAIAGLVASCGARTALPVPDGSIEDEGCPTSEVVARPAPVDVIVVVDQSGSMINDIARVKANINRLSEFLASTKLDYRIVMIARVGRGNTDVCVPPPLGGPSCASNDPVFRTSNQRIGSTDALRQVIATYASNEPPYVWRDFIRPEALKAFVPITDDNSAMPAEQFEQTLTKLDPAMFGTLERRKYIFYPICGADAVDPNVRCGPSMVNTGPVYVDLARRTGGKWFPLCAPDFGPVFTNIGKGLAVVVACELSVPRGVPAHARDPSRVVVQYVSPSGTATSVPFDGARDCDDGAEGWQFDATRTKVRLCGNVCKNLRGDLGAKVTLRFDCSLPADAGDASSGG